MRSGINAAAIVRHMIFESELTYREVATALGMSKTELQVKLQRNDVGLDELVALTKLTGLELVISEGAVSVQKRHRTFYQESSR